MATKLLTKVLFCSVIVKQFKIRQAVGVHACWPLLYLGNSFPCAAEEMFATASSVLSVVTHAES